MDQDTKHLAKLDYAEEGCFDSDPEIRAFCKNLMNENKSKHFYEEA